MPQAPARTALAASRVVLATLFSMGTLFTLVYVGKLFAWL